jgi:hypothetical protein
MTKYEKPQNGARIFHRFTGGAAATDANTNQENRTIRFVFASPGAVRGDDH